MNYSKKPQGIPLCLQILFENFYFGNIQLSLKKYLGLRVLEFHSIKKFLFEKFNQINSEIETILFEMQSNDLSKEQNNFSNSHLDVLKNLLKKIDKLETKILYKANLFESFSKSNP